MDWIAWNASNTIDQFKRDPDNRLDDGGRTGSGTVDNNPELGSTLRGADFETEKPLYSTLTAAYLLHVGFDGVPLKTTVIQRFAEFWHGKVVC